VIHNLIQMALHWPRIRMVLTRPHSPQ